MVNVWRARFDILIDHLYLLCKNEEEPICIDSRNAVMPNSHEALHAMKIFAAKMLRWFYIVGELWSFLRGIIFWVVWYEKNDLV